MLLHGWRLSVYRDERTARVHRSIGDQDSRVTEFNFCQTDFRCADYLTKAKQCAYRIRALHESPPIDARRKFLL